MIDFKEGIAQLLSKYIEGLELEQIKDMIEIPTDSKMGDYAFPCFRLAKTLRKAPPAIAEELAGKLQEDSLFAKVENVNAYVNMFLSREAFMKELTTVVAKEKDRFGSSDGTEPNHCNSLLLICKAFPYYHIRSTVIGIPLIRFMIF